MVEVFPRSVSDVVRAIEHARDTGSHLVPRGGGHCFAGRSSTDGIVLDLAELNDITVSGTSATIGAGARLAQVYAALHARGRTIPAGCGATVGIAGLTLGGGIGLLGRKYGLTCDRLTSARVVLANGSVVDTDQTREPDLFWALRGAGGGQFGVVTSFTFHTVPEPAVTRFEARLAAVDQAIAAWQEWAPRLPDDVTANLTVARGEAVLHGVSLLEETATRELVQDFSDVDVRGGLAYSQVKQELHEEPPPGLRLRSEFFTHPMRTRTIEALCSALGNGKLAFTAMGGAYNRVPATATAFAHRSTLFLLEHIGEIADNRVDRSWAIAHADGSGGVYPNFPDPALDDWATAYHAGNHPRLVAIKHAYDPDRFFDFPQSV